MAEHFNPNVENLIEGLDLPEIATKADGKLDDCKARRYINEIFRQWEDIAAAEIELKALLTSHPEWADSPAVYEYVTSSINRRAHRGNGQKSTQFDWRDYAIEHDSLLSRELPSLDYVVDQLLTTPGTAILAAPKKRAKSWMALQLSQSVAAGAPFLGLQTKQGSVIHMALEDGERRLQRRLEMQNSTTGLPITYLTKFKALNSNAGIQALINLIQEKQPTLVVIDTLAAAKNRYLDENDAGPTADLFNSLHDLAINENTVILIIAHHGKASIGDVGFDIRGSSAISGATDCNIGLYKNTDGTYDLKAEGRDIGEVDIRISFDAEITWCWQYQGDAKDVRRTEAENRIIEAIDLLGGDIEASVIANELDLNRVTVQTHLKRMRVDGLITYEVKGKKILYSIPLTIPTLPTTPNTLQDQPVGTVGDGIKLVSKANHTQSVGNVGHIKNSGKNPNDLPPEYPALPCSCGCGEYWLRGNEWLCSKCHPKPRGKE